VFGGKCHKITQVSQYRYALKAVKLIKNAARTQKMVARIISVIKILGLRMLEA
jgi:hypothetical protein